MIKVLSRRLLGWNWRLRLLGWLNLLGLLSWLNLLGLLGLLGLLSSLIVSCLFLGGQLLETAVHFEQVVVLCHPLAAVGRAKLDVVGTDTDRQDQDHAN